MGNLKRCREYLPCPQEPQISTPQPTDDAGHLLSQRPGYPVFCSASPVRCCSIPRSHSNAREDWYSPKIGMLVADLQLFCHLLLAFLSSPFDNSPRSRRKKTPGCSCQRRQDGKCWQNKGPVGLSALAWAAWLEGRGGTEGQGSSI